MINETLWSDSHFSLLCRLGRGAGAGGAPSGALRAYGCRYDLDLHYCI